MEEKMFCFQCEQTVGGHGCEISGACGKTPVVSELQDELTGEAIGLARAYKGKKIEEDATKLILEALFTCITNVNFEPKVLHERIAITKAKREAVDPTSKALDMNEIWHADEDTRSLKSLTLFGLRGMGAYAYHALALGYSNDEVNEFVYEALRTIADSNDGDLLLKTVMETGRINLICMELLDTANTKTYGDPVPTKVSLKVKKGPFIVVTGHDLKDLKELLDQTTGKGIDIYTHGEMLPCLAYPELKKYPQLKGNYGTAWQNQQKEFANLPAPILFTTNCIMPVLKSYDDRVFTTEVVAYPGMVHIDDAVAGGVKDFSPVIAKALELGGFEVDTQFHGINGGEELTTGFGHNAVLAVADKVVDAVKSGALKHIFLVGGCDGAKPGRNYYTHFVEQAPKDTVILTLACGKYRFNDLDLGNLGELPRLMDMGQCNDSYSAIKVAVALADVFGCGVNDLPLSMVLSWYEQKAVCILLTLLHLNIKNMLIGPTLPAFISPNVLQLLIKNYNLGLVSTPEADLKMLLGE